VPSFFAYDLSPFFPIRLRPFSVFVKPNEPMSRLPKVLPVQILASIALLASASSVLPQTQPVPVAPDAETLPPAPESHSFQTGFSTIQEPSPSQSSAPVSQPTDSQKSDHDLAEEQLKAQEKQRVMGVMATFNTTTNKDALPLSPGQKFKLFFKSSTDPWPFLLAGAVAGIGQADDSYPTWGQGAQGYAKRYGAAFSDAFIGNFFGNAVLPAILREDPRYFQKRTGSKGKRFFWAAASTFWCKRDNGKWGPNYANVGGNLIGAAIARAYYPPAERTFGDTISDGITVSVEGIVGAELIEFWPDIVRHFRRKKTDQSSRVPNADFDSRPTVAK
jgi:hypothetical protein